MTHRPTPGGGLRFAWLFWAGPLLWCAYFWLHRLANENACATDGSAMAFVVISTLTGGTLLSLAIPRWRALRDEKPRITTPVRAGLMLGGLLLVFGLLVALPRLLHHPC